MTLRTGTEQRAEELASAPAWARGVCAGVHATGCRDVVYVPDNPLSHVVRVFEAQYSDVRLVVATREEEAFGIAAGLYLGGRKATVMLQSSGLGNSLNAITSLLVPYQIPVLMVVSMRGDDGEWNTAQMPMGRAVGEILTAIGVAHSTVGSADEAAEATRRAGEKAFAARSSCACLLPKRLTALAGPTSASTPSPGPPASEPGPTKALASSPTMLRTGSAGPLRRRRSDPAPTAMTRFDATRIVVDQAGRGAIVASLGHPAYDLFTAGDRALNFYTWGSMGLASSIGLGLALARPEVRIFVVDGDASLLMNLGSLATIGLLQPGNLVLVVMDNELFATTGGQPSPTAFGADLAAAARAMRIERATTVTAREELVGALTSTSAGPRVIVAKVHESPPTAKPPNDCVALKERFMSALAGVR